MHHSLKRNHPALGCGGSGTCDDTLLMGCQSRTGHCGHTDSHPGPFRIAGPSTSTFCMMGSNWKTWRTLMWTWNPTEILTRSSGSNPGAVRKQHYVTNHQTELWGKKNPERICFHFLSDGRCRCVTAVTGHMQNENRLLNRLHLFLSTGAFPHHFPSKGTVLTWTLVMQVYLRVTLSRPCGPPYFL